MICPTCLTCPQCRGGLLRPRVSLYRRAVQANTMVAMAVVGMGVLAREPMSVEMVTNRPMFF